MRILLAQDSDWIKRNPAQQHHLAERMISRGHEVRVIDYDILWNTGGKRELLSKRSVFEVSKVLDGIKVTVVRPGILKIPILEYFSMIIAYSKEIAWQLKEYQPGIAIGNSILTNYLLMRSATRNDVPFIFLLVDAEYTLIPSRILRPLGKLIERRILRMADKVIVINDALREYAIEMGARPEKTVVIRAGIDRVKYDPNMDGVRIREQYHIAPNDKVLFFMGWLYKFSGLSEVVTEMLKLDRKDLKLLIVGDGEAFDELRLMIANNKIEDRIILAGKQPFTVIPEYIAASDVCLLPARLNETMRHIVPIKMYEYMSMGKPVVSTKLPGVMKEFGQDNGVVYVDGPEEVLSKAVGLMNSGEIPILGAKSRAFVSNHDWAIVTKEFEDTLRGVIDSARESTRSE